MSWMLTDEELRFVDHELKRLKHRRDVLIVTLRDIGGLTWRELGEVIYPDRVDDGRRIAAAARQLYRDAMVRLENEETNERKRKRNDERQARHQGDADQPEHGYRWRDPHRAHHRQG